MALFVVVGWQVGAVKKHAYALFDDSLQTFMIRQNEIELLSTIQPQHYCDGPSCNNAGPTLLAQHHYSWAKSVGKVQAI